MLIMLFQDVRFAHVR